jgi:hypothetical protein
LAQNATTSRNGKKTTTAQLEAQLQELREDRAADRKLIEVLQREIVLLKQEMQKQDATLQQIQSVATDASSKATAAVGQTQQEQESVTALKTDVVDLKTGVSSTVTALQETQRAVSEPPTAIHFKGITITPGGFLAAEFVRRSRALAADINTPFNSVTMPGASQSTMSEFYGSGRQSRLSLLADGRIKNTLLSGYYEADFLSAAATSNNNQSNSYSLRQRQVWGQAAFDNGWSFTGGQMWSLVTETRHGEDNRTEATPLTIDAQYNVGFSWARQYGLRLVKNFGNKVWFGISVENPQATVTTHNNAANFLVGSAGASGGLYNPAISTCTSTLTSTTNGIATGVLTTCSPIASYSFNPSPDVIAKLAFEPGFGHYEIFGIYSRFRDRVFPCAEASPAFPCGTITTPSTVDAFNSSKNGGGVGANARWSFLNKHVDVGVHGLAGNGIGRYGSGQLPDTSIHANGTFDLIRNYQALATLEWHGPKLDLYFNTGAEYDGRAWDFDPFSGKYVGYASPNFPNAGCFTETLPQNGSGFLPGGLSSCTADTKVLVEGTAGLWFRLYDGSKEKVNRGRVQWGAQYSYVDRQTWSGLGASLPGGLFAPPVAPHGIDSMIFTSFRYYLP